MTRPLIALTTAFVLFTLMIYSPTQALEIRGNDEVYVSEKLVDDLLMGGTNAKFDGEIRGDIIAAGMDVAVDGIVDGNVNVAGYTVKVGGFVLRSVRMAGAMMTASGQIENNLMMFGGSARLSSTCTVSNDAHITADVVFMSGTVLGDLWIDGGEVVISGTIDQDVEIDCEKLRIDQSAVIVGDLVYSSPERATIADGAQINGEKKWKKRTKSESGLFGSFLSKTVLFFGAFIVGLLLTSCCRFSTISVKDEILSDMPKALGIGALTLVVAPIVLALALVTVVGIPASLLGILAYMILFYVSKIFVACAIGDKVIGLLSSSKRRSQALSMLVGLIILTILFNLPYVGWIIYLLTAAVGFGGIMIVFNKARRGTLSHPT